VEANRTAKRHREFVRDRLGVTYDSAEVRGIAETAIRAAAQTKDNPADLINVALEELVRKGRELPGYTTLDKMVAKIRAEVNLLAESHIRYGGFGALAFRLVSDTYIALFSHFIVAGCGRRCTSWTPC
jgi:hypothetical protein